MTSTTAAAKLPICLLIMSMEISTQDRATGRPEESNSHIGGSQIAVLLIICYENGVLTIRMQISAPMISLPP